jgi:hypothetical protein
MSLYGLSRSIYRVARLESATRNPGRFARNRVKSHALRAVGFWSLWRRWWRA